MLVWPVLLLGKYSNSPFLLACASSKPGALLIRKNRFAIGIVGDAGVRGSAQQPRLFVGMILILIFAEVLGTLGSHHRICWHSDDEI